MNLKKITFRNIGPYGNKLVEIDLLPEGGLWLVSGKNGGGKSTLLNLPKALFYGKIDKLKKDSIANRFNKHGYIQGEIQLSPTNTCVIEREFSGSSLIVYKNGEDIGKAGISNYQEFIDNEITQLPYNIFSNIVSLSVNDFKSFISMTPNDKRHIIDKLFSMEIINKMYELVKKDIREIKYNIDIYNKEIIVLNQNTERAKQELEQLLHKNDVDNKGKLKDILNELKTLKTNLNKAADKKTELTTKKTTLLPNIDKLQKTKRDLSNELNSIDKKIELYNKDMCPVCETPFVDPSYDFIKDKLKDTKKEKTDRYEEINKALETYVTTLATINDGINKLSSYINTNVYAAKQLKAQYDELNKNNETTEFTSVQNIINDNNIRVNNIELEKKSKDIDYKYLGILESLYSGDGIKRKILESYLPHLNAEVETTLNELNFPYTLQFSSDFEPIIEQLGLEVPPETLSTGERKKADLAVLISIIRMMKRKFPRLNLFMLDEVLSSIDSDGILDIISYLHKTSKELHINIFIVNHTVLPIEFFDKKLTITKNDNFSDISIENVN